MSERYKPRALYRAARARPFVPPIDRPLHDVAVRPGLTGSRVIVNCKHDQPWMSCNLCSTVKGKKL